jgi:hypothetical protein
MPIDIYSITTIVVCLSLRLTNPQAIGVTPASKMYTAFLKLARECHLGFQTIKMHIQIHKLAFF